VGKGFNHPKLRPRVNVSRTNDHRCAGIYTYVVELWDSSGENVVDLLTEVGDLQIARDTYQAALKRWPGGVITLRQGVRVIEDSRRTL
jgi:hypothetical protein